MRKFILFLLILCSSLSVSAVEPYSRDSVIQAKGLSSQQIYESLKKWFITNAKFDSRYIIEHDDAANKHLVGRMTFRYNCSNINWAAGSGHISVVVDVMARDGRFRIKLSDFNHISEDKDYAYHWSLGTVTSEIPEKWASGWKTKQQRETYKRVIKRCQEYADFVLHSVAEYAKDFKPIEAEEW